MTLAEARQLLNEVKAGIPHPVVQVTRALIVTGDL